MVVPPVDHDCVLKDVVVNQANRIAKLEHDIEQLKNSLIGPKSERSKMPRVNVGKKPTAEEKLAKRRANAAGRAEGYRPRRSVKSIPLPNDRRPTVTIRDFAGAASTAVALAAAVVPTEYSLAKVAYGG
jgi:hypothetical protein